MAGHSHASNVKHKKANNNLKKSASFTKFANKIYVAAKSDPDPSKNPNLRSAIKIAQSASVPKSTIENAIQKASNPSKDNELEHIRYNGTVGSIYFVIECLTNNRNRTAGQMRSIFTKYKGALVETGSIEYTFSNIGLIKYPKTHKNSEDDFFQFASENNCIDFVSDNDEYEIYTEKNNLHSVSKLFLEKFGDPDFAELIWKSNQFPTIDEEGKKMAIDLLKKLKDNEDVQEIFTNIN